MIRTRRRADGGTSYQVYVWDALAGSKVPVGTCRTLREAKTLERREAIERSADRVRSTMTVRQYAARWLETLHHLEVTTQDLYRSSADKLAESFGARVLSDIGRQEARAWAAGQPEARRSAVRVMFNAAVEDELVATNPFANLRLPQSRGRKDIVALTEPELTHLADTALDVHPGELGVVWRALILTAGWSACRPGELFDLDWEPQEWLCRASGRTFPTSHVDLDGGELHIRGQRRRVASSGGASRVPYTKNKRTRVVALAPPAVEALRQVTRYPDLDAVFYTARGDRLQRGHMPYYWYPIRRAAGFPKMAFYELRHFGATALLERGATPADVAFHLGHTDNGDLVMSTYGHPDEARARARVAGLVG